MVITEVWEQVINVLWNSSIIPGSGRVGVLRIQQESVELTSELNDLKGSLGRNLERTR